ncbi:MAG: BCCT family transporter [Fusobacteriaceae bacterium]
MKNSRYRKNVIIVPFLLILVCSISSIFFPDFFNIILEKVTGWILDTFGWLFSIVSLLIFITSVIVFFSPLGKVTIGGIGAKKILNKKNWAMITVCTTLAGGLMFWGSAEPLYHYYTPPEFLGILPKTHQAANFAMATMLLHWTLIPSSIYAIPGLIIGLMHYNLKKKYSLGIGLYPLLGDKNLEKYSGLLDGTMIFSMGFSLSSSVATAILSICGGIAILSNSATSNKTIAILIIIAVVMFSISSFSGVKRGITKLSQLNTIIFFLIIVSLLFFSPFMQILNYFVEGLGMFINNFFNFSTITGGATNEKWAQNWTVFYWSAWMAWGPISGMFLGSISKGYTVRQYLIFSLVIPASATAIWIAFFTGNSILLDISTNGKIYEVLQTIGIEQVVYSIFYSFPFSKGYIFLFTIAVFLSLVTAADSNTNAIMKMCMKSQEKKEGSKSVALLQFFWAILIMLISYFGASYLKKGGESIKRLAYIGGFPALIIMILLMINIWIILIKGKLDVHSEDRDTNF